MRGEAVGRAASRLSPSSWPSPRKRGEGSAPSSRGAERHGDPECAERPPDPHASFAPTAARLSQHAAIARRNTRAHRGAGRSEGTEPDDSNSNSGSPRRFAPRDDVSGRHCKTGGHINRRPTERKWRSRQTRQQRRRHLWTAPIGKRYFDALIALVGCGHMSGLLVRVLTAGPDDFRQPRSLSSRRARGS